MEYGIEMAQHVISEGTFPQNALISLEGVEFVCLINKQGKIEQSVYKNGIILSKEKHEMFTMGVQLHNSMQRDFDEEFGPVHYSITERENSRFVSIPTHAGILMAKLTKSVDPFVFVNEITTMMNFSKTLFESGVCQ